MTIALDWDDTYTADPPLWDAFIERAMERGHSVWIVTAREGDEEDRATVKVDLLPSWKVKFTNRTAKRWFMERAGISVDVWIDDRPERILSGV
jgi:hypothetical protein